MMKNYGGVLEPMNSTRDRLLGNLRRQLVPQVPLPEVLEGPWITFQQPVEKFAEMLQFVGGSCTRVQNVGEITTALAQYPQWQAAKRVYSRVEGVPGNVDLEAIDDPHELADVDFVIYPGEFAVAENGAVWLTDVGLKHRVVFFITQYLVLVLSERDIVDNMHQAYARAKMPQPGFGVYLSGPSKTADIEQSLVIGAHGCRQTQVFLLP